MWSRLPVQPQGPETAWFLNDEEKKIACLRLQSDGYSSDEKVFKKAQVWDALKDPFCWAAVLFAFLGTFASPVLKVCNPILL
jgi:hypothetical protein